MSKHAGQRRPFGTYSGLDPPSRVVVHFGQRSREAVEGSAREWIPAGHGCSGRRPSSLLAGSVWLAPQGAALEVGPGSTASNPWEVDTKTVRR